MRKTIRQSVQRMTRGQPELEVATIVSVDVLSTDANNVVTSVAPSITVNIHGKGGLQRIELSAGIDPLELNIGDQLFVTRVQDRYIGVALLPISNRTQGGGESEGTGESVEFMAQPQNVTGLIAGSQLELAWQPVQGADYYEIWVSESADPQSDGARVLARTPNTTWTGKGDGTFFDDGMYYGIVPHAESGTGGRAGSFSEWLQPTFAGNYALGILSKNQTTGIGGSLVVTKSASITRADFTSLDNPQTWTIDVCDPISAHSTTPLFAVNEILRAVDTSGNALWLKVTATRDMDTYWRYTVNKQSPSAGTNYTIKSGSQVLSYGTSGQGTFAVSADGTFGAGTLWTIFTHAGSPWATTTPQVYANSSGQLVAGAGDVTLDSDGITLVSGTGTPNMIKWNSSGVSRALMHGWGTAADGNFQAKSFGTTSARSVLLGEQTAGSKYALWGALGHTTASLNQAYADVYDGTNRMAFQVFGQYATLYAVAGSMTGFIIGGNSPSAFLHLKSSAPDLLFDDTTASAKKGYIKNDADHWILYEYNGGTPTSLIDVTLATGATTFAGTITGTTTGNAPVGSAFVTIGTDATLTSERALTGTANQITVTDNGAGSTVVLSTPQGIGTSSNVQFGAITATGAITHGTYAITKTIQKTGIADNSATGVFTITTTNETGNVDGGAFVCDVLAIVTHIATNGAGNNAVVKYRGSFSREIISTGTGANTAVEDTFTGTSAASASATRDIASVTMSVTETSEYVQTVNFTVDLTGSSVQTAEVTVFVTLLWTGFLTAPVIAAA